MIDLGLDLIFACVLYIAAVLAIGATARQARQDVSLSDYYLANRSIGVWVLLLTLFATQYSGNSFSGFPGQTYREGLAYFMSVPFMIAIVAGNHNATTPESNGTYDACHCPRRMPTDRTWA